MEKGFEMRSILASLDDFQGYLLGGEIMTIMVEKRMDLGNILTILTIIGSVVSFLVAWEKEAANQKTERANRIRAAAAKTLVKLDRWKGVSLSLFDQVKPDFVDTKELLKKKFDVIEARDHLWKALHMTRSSMIKHALDEQVEMAYLELYAFHPEIRDLFNKTLSKIKDEEQKVFAELLGETEDAVLAWKDRKDEYSTAKLWTALLKISEPRRAAYQDKVEAILTPLFTTPRVTEKNETVL